ncbi:transposase family protein [Leptolyngbya sp. FACHB-261]|nr:transposase family protein [Leptolyngbya sp. FACHB-261]
MFYLKGYLTFNLAGFFLGVNRSQCHRWQHQLLPILEQALGQELVLPQRKIRSVAEFVQLLPEVKDRRWMAQNALSSTPSIKTDNRSTIQATRSDTRRRTW